MFIYSLQPVCGFSTTMNGTTYKIKKDTDYNYYFFLDKYFGKNKCTIENEDGINDSVVENVLKKIVNTSYELKHDNYYLKFNKIQEIQENTIYCFESKQNNTTIEYNNEKILTNSFRLFLKDILKNINETIENTGYVFCFSLKYGFILMDRGVFITYEKEYNDFIEVNDNMDNINENKNKNNEEDDINESDEEDSIEENETDEEDNIMENPLLYNLQKTDKKIDENSIFFINNININNSDISYFDGSALIKDNQSSFDEVSPQQFLIIAAVAGSLIFALTMNGDNNNDKEDSKNSDSKNSQVIESKNNNNNINYDDIESRDTNNNLNNEKSRYETIEEIF